MRHDTPGWYRLLSPQERAAHLAAERERSRRRRHPGRGRPAELDAATGRIIADALDGVLARWRARGVIK